MSDSIYYKLKSLEREISLLNYKLSTNKKFVLGEQKNNVYKVKALEAKITKLISQLKDAV